MKTHTQKQVWQREREREGETEIEYRVVNVLPTYFFGVLAGLFTDFLVALKGLFGSFWIKERMR